jgi:peptide-methionine (S)-S-oxide reductase
MSLFRREPRMPSAADALPGHEYPLFRTDETHIVLGTPLDGPVPEGHEVAVFGLGCFWGAERKFWETEGVHSTAVGYSGGFTKNPTYDEVCSGRTGHAETVRVVFDPEVVSYSRLLKLFWESHDPTQGYRQGADLGTQYRSVIEYTTPEQAAAAEASRASYQGELEAAGYGKITTEIVGSGEFYFAEGYHQQYLDKNPRGYCGIGGTGVGLSDPGTDAWGSCPVGVITTDGTTTLSAE